MFVRVGLGCRNSIKGQDLRLKAGMSGYRTGFCVVKDIDVLILFTMFISSSFLTLCLHNSKVTGNEAMNLISFLLSRSRFLCGGQEPSNRSSTVAATLFTYSNELIKHCGLHQVRKPGEIESVCRRNYYFM